MKDVEIHAGVFANRSVMWKCCAAGRVLVAEIVVHVTVHVGKLVQLCQKRCR